MKADRQLSDFISESLRQKGTDLDLRRLRCALGGHEYRYEGIMLGNRIERCLRCRKLRKGPTSELATVHHIPTSRTRQRYGSGSGSEEERTSDNANGGEASQQG